MENIFFCALISFILINSFGHCKKCKDPPTAESFENQKYKGIWYEIGKIQTPGGAFWQRDTVCTIATFDPYEPIYGNGDIEYSCRKHSPEGAFNNASGILKAQDESRNGYFRQQLYVSGIAMPEVDYRYV